MRGLTPGERLIDLAHAVLSPRDVVLAAADSPGDREFALVRAALDFRSRPAEFRLRAIVEEWDHYRIVRELY